MFLGGKVVQYIHTMFGGRNAMFGKTYIHAASCFKWKSSVGHKPPTSQWSERDVGANEVIVLAMK